MTLKRDETAKDGRRDNEKLGDPGEILTRVRNADYITVNATDVINEGKKKSHHTRKLFDINEQDITNVLTKERYDTGQYNVKNIPSR